MTYVARCCTIQYKCSIIEYSAYTLIVINRYAVDVQSPDQEYRVEEGRIFMADKILENNQASIVGTVVSEFQFSHEVYGEGFYLMEVSVNRLSDFADIIPIMVSERLVDVHEDARGKIDYVTGQFRSYNRQEEKKNRLVLSVFARDMEYVEPEEAEH